MVVAASLFLVRCNSEDNLVTENAKEGGLVDLATPSINYVVGNTNDYKFSLRVYQANEQTVKLYLYKSFYSVADDTTDGNPWSGEILQSTVDVTETVTHYISSPGYFYADLTSGLTLNGSPLPESDGDLNIGDFFQFRVVAELSDGRKVQQAGRVKMTVSTRYAGTYKFVEGLYYRIGVLTNTGSYWSPTYEIQSIDAKTYKMFGLAAWMDNAFYFQINDDMSITYPAEWQGAAQMLNGQPLINCIDNATDFVPEVNCGTSNIVVKDDVGGKDRIYQTVGYYTTGSGPRVFYQVFEKVTE
jgi:hypothetical protein